MVLGADDAPIYNALSRILPKLNSLLYEAALGGKFNQTIRAIWVYNLLDFESIYIY